MTMWVMSQGINANVAKRIVETANQDLWQMDLLVWQTKRDSNLEKQIRASIPL